MLKFYRKNIKLIIWVIILSFVIWGVGTFSLSKESSVTYIGTVGKEKISHKEFLTTFRYYDLLSRTEHPKKEENSENKQKIEPPSFEEIRALTWQVIAMSRIAKQEGVSVSDQEVRKEIERTFSSNGEFNHQLYSYFIENNFKGRARDFEEAIRKQLIVQKMREKILLNAPENERENRWISWLGSHLNNMKIVDYSQKQSGA